MQRDWLVRGICRFEQQLRDNGLNPERLWTHFSVCLRF